MNVSERIREKGEKRRVGVKVEGEDKTKRERERERERKVCWLLLWSFLRVTSTHSHVS